MSRLRQRIVRLIEANGPLSVADYMARHGIGDPAAAAIQVVIDAVRRLSVLSDQIAADAPLARHKSAEASLNVKRGLF